MVPLSQQVLRTDLAGMPLEWVDYRAAARLYALEQVAYACGDTLFRLRGGLNARTQRRSQLQIHSIAAIVNRDGQVCQILPLTEATTEGFARMIAGSSRMRKSGNGTGSRSGWAPYSV